MDFKLKNLEIGKRIYIATNAIVIYVMPIDMMRPTLAGLLYLCTPVVVFILLFL